MKKVLKFKTLGDKILDDIVQETSRLMLDKLLKEQREKERKLEPAWPQWCPVEKKYDRS